MFSQVDIKYIRLIDFEKVSIYIEVNYVQYVEVLSLIVKL